MPTTNPVHSASRTSESTIPHLSTLSTDQFVDMFAGLRNQRIKRVRQRWTLAIACATIVAIAGILLL